MRKFEIILLTVFMLTAVIGRPAETSAQTAREYYNLGMTFSDLGDIDTAIKHLSKAISKNRKYAAAYNQLAICYMAKGSTRSLKQAQDAAQKANRYDKDNIQYMFTLGEVYYRRNLNSYSEKTIAQILEIDPGNRRAKAWIAGNKTEWENNIPRLSNKKKARRKQFDIPVDAVGFRGKDGKTEVEFYYGMPIFRTTLRKYNGILTGNIRQKISIYEKTGVLAAESLSVTSVRLDPAGISRRSSDAIPLYKSFEIQPGNYDIVVILEDTISGNFGVVRDILNVESYETGLLQLSDIITAYHIILKDPLKPLNRQNIKLYHHPAHIFYPGQELHVYFEIYNLFNAKTDGVYRYKLEYAVTSVSSNSFDKSRMRKIFANATVSDIKKEVRWISQNFTGFGSTDYQKILIQYAIKDPGEYILTLRVTDLNCDLTSQKSIPIWITERK